MSDHEDFDDEFGEVEDDFEDVAEGESDEDGGEDGEDGGDDGVDDEDGKSDGGKSGSTKEEDDDSVASDELELDLEDDDVATQITINAVRTKPTTYASRPYLTIYEKTRLIAERIAQLEHGAPPNVEVPNGVINALQIAQLEHEQGKLPLVVHRPLPNGEVIRIPVSQLIDVTRN